MKNKMREGGREGGGEGRELHKHARMDGGWREGGIKIGVS